MNQNKNLFLWLVLIVNKIIIETVFRFTIHFDYITIRNAKEDQLENISSKIESFAKNHNTEIVENFNGNAACGPYMILESENKVNLDTVRGMIERYISRFKNIRYS